MKRYVFRLLNFLYKWLPRVFLCHCRPDRSFQFRGVRFPICARCTGELAGILFAALTGWFYRPSIAVLCLMLLPMVTDGAVQLLTAYESTNLRRFVTGLLFGYAGAILFAISCSAIFMLGHGLGQQFTFLI